MKIELYCDGSSSGKSNQPTGWAWVAIDAEKQERLFYGSKCANVGTNNTAELFAVIDGLLECVQKGYIGNVIVVSDSKYALGIASGEYFPSKNLEECKVARDVYIMAKAENRWVRGHSGHIWNEMVDDLAGKARLTLVPEKKKQTKFQKAVKNQKKILKKQYLKDRANEKT